MLRTYYEALAGLSPARCDLRRVPLLLGHRGGVRDRSAAAAPQHPVELERGRTKGISGSVGRCADDRRDHRARRARSARRAAPLDRRGSLLRAGREGRALVALAHGRGDPRHALDDVHGDDGRRGHQVRAHRGRPGRRGRTVSRPGARELRYRLRLLRRRGVGEPGADRRGLRLRRDHGAGVPQRRPSRAGVEPRHLGRLGPAVGVRDRSADQREVLPVDRVSTGGRSRSSTVNSASGRPPTAGCSGTCRRPRASRSMPRASPSSRSCSACRCSCSTRSIAGPLVFLALFYRLSPRLQAAQQGYRAGAHAGCVVAHVEGAARGGIRRGGQPDGNAAVRRSAAHRARRT